MGNLNKLLVVIFLAFSFSAEAYIDPKDRERPAVNTNPTVSLRSDCTPSTAQIDMQINNVRARLLSGGDVWWDLNDGMYVVPKVPVGSGIAEVSSIFAGAVWLGGLDPVGNLKVAAVQYRQGAATDYYSGPIDPITGLTDQETCDNWDRFFRVLGEEVREASNLWEAGELTEDNLPDNVKFWPGKGNPFFLERFNFELPNTGQGLGSFWDENFDGVYNALDGDIPIIEIRDCEPLNRAAAIELLPDEMTFWIYNDSGGPHTESNGDFIQMEIQVQAFAYATNDEINDMTFQRYKLINRAQADIRETYFAMWVDADLGCSEDDFIGCDVGRSLGFTYNQDAEDGDNGVNCSTGVPTYGTNIPVIGTDYFRGPLGPKAFALDADGNRIIDPETGEFVLLDIDFGETGDTLVQLGMSSFVYINRQGSGPPEAWTWDPQTAEQYYNYLQGFWNDGRPVTQGDCGFTLGNDPVRFTMPNDPSDPDGWSFCTSCTGEGDRRTLQASGPFLLQPGAVNELIIGVVWVPDLEYPCPDLGRFTAADDLAQGLFDNCFNLLDGPDAPDVCPIALDKEIILVLSNDTISSNNAFEAYQETDPLAPVEQDGDYRFEGYLVYQLIDPQVSPSEYDDIERARLVSLVDVDNGITEIFNWTSNAVPGVEEDVWTFTREVEGTDSGIRNTFRITEDQFASGNRTLINHTKYYFSVVAYAHNEFEPFNPFPPVTGQRTPYLEGRRNIQVYEVIPRPIVYETLNSQFGDGATITRLAGVGTGQNFLQLAEGEHERILAGTTEGRINYAAGSGPIDIQIYNPLEVRDGDYTLRIVGDHFVQGSICELEPGARWELTADNGTVIASANTIDALNEQIIPQFGFSVTIGQSGEAGNLTENNGTLGASLEYEDLNGVQWYTALADEGVGQDIFDNAPFLRPMLDYLRTQDLQADNQFDPNQTFSTFGNGLWTPFFLADGISAPEAPFTYFLSPASRRQGLVRNSNSLGNLNNVDIVMTSDKSQWSRCIVVETNGRFFEDAGLDPVSIDNDPFVDMYDLRQSPSVDQDGNPDGDGIGMSWFPGYAVDVESGKRLNIFFGENSYFDDEYDASIPEMEGLNIGADMLFNPNDIVLTGAGPEVLTDPGRLFAGGHHMIYVTRTEYDECAAFREAIGVATNAVNLIPKSNVQKTITWTSIPLNNPDVMLPYSEGYVPNDVTFSLRVENPYNREDEVTDLNLLSICNPIGELPEYEFTISGAATSALTENEVSGVLSNVNIVPNPYFGFSRYETDQRTNTVKITNLPARADVTIYSLDGRFITSFRRDEVDPVKGGANPGTITGQGIPDIEWNLKNFAGIPVASGVYLVHIVAPELNEQITLKWFGVNRKFDPSGL